MFKLGPIFFCIFFYFWELLSSFLDFTAKFSNTSPWVRGYIPMCKIKHQNKSLIIMALWNKEWKRAAMVRKSWTCEKLQGTHTHTRKQHQWTFQGQDGKCSHQSVSCTRDVVCVLKGGTIYRPRKDLDRIIHFRRNHFCWSNEDFLESYLRRQMFR